MSKFTLALDIIDLADPADVRVTPDKIAEIVSDELARMGNPAIIHPRMVINDNHVLPSVQDIEIKREGGI